MLEWDSDAEMQELKQRVHDYWNRESCGTNVARREKFSRDYFEEIESHRYRQEPEIFSFAQFTRFHGSKVLEVGVGAGTDFIQWVRAGALAYGLDLTEEAVAHVLQRLSVYGLRAQDVRVGDAEALPYPDDTFDLVYSWGVLHHTPDTGKAVREVVRVTRPGGTCKLMLYNRHSVTALLLWLRFCLLTGRVWHSLSWVLYHHMESLGTKAFTVPEVRRLLQDLPCAGIRIGTPLRKAELPEADAPARTRLAVLLARLLAAALGWRAPGWFMQIEFQKPGRDQG